MTAGQFVDRVLNAALIKAADAANRIMAVTFPMRQEPRGWDQLLTDAEAERDVWEPGPVPEWPSLAEWEQELRDAFLASRPKTCDISAPLSPRHGVEEVAPPSGAGAAASAGLAAAGAGGHPNRATSELLEDAAQRLERADALVWGHGCIDHRLTALLAELRDRAAAFAAFGD